MSFFDGTFGCNESKLKEEFPIEVTPDLRFSEDRKKMAVINSFTEGTQYFELADPKVDEEDGETYVFYHAFVGKDAETAKASIESFLADVDNADGESIKLFRKDGEKLFMYSFGFISSKQYEKSEEDVFFLPLKRYMFKCPVCGHRTLQYLDMFMICGECGWEDEGMTDEDSESCGANGDYSIREYREEYLKKRRKIRTILGKDSLKKMMHKLNYLIRKYKSDAYVIVPAELKDTVKGKYVFLPFFQFRHRGDGTMFVEKKLAVFPYDARKRESVDIGKMASFFKKFGFEMQKGPLCFSSDCFLVTQPGSVMSAHARAAGGELCMPECAWKKIAMTV